jgi:hypothetical protein
MTDMKNKRLTQILWALWFLIGPFVGYFIAEALMHLVRYYPQVVVFLVAITPFAVSFVVLRPNFPNYRKTYDALLAGKIRVITYTAGQKGIVGLVLFAPLDPKQHDHLSCAFHHSGTGGDITLVGGGHLRVGILTFLNPVSLTWLIRITSLMERLASGEDPVSISRELRIAQLLRSDRKRLFTSSTP